MPNLYTEIEIDAPKLQVWQALVQKEQWMYWNTFLYDCDSNRPFTPGQEVFLSVRRVPGEADIEFQALVTLVQPEVCLRWVSAIPGLANEHVFELQAIDAQRTKYIHQESFTGWLSRIFWPLIRQDEQQGLKRMARELKQHVEGQTASSSLVNRMGDKL